MEFELDSKVDEGVFALKQECADPVMTASIVDFDLYNYLNGEIEGQALDETVDLDVIPQPSYPSASPNYESEGVPSPPGMDGGMSPVSIGGDSVGLMSPQVDFSDLLAQCDNNSNDNFSFNLLKDSFVPDEKAESAQGSSKFTVLAIPEAETQSSHDDSEESMEEPAEGPMVAPRRVSQRNLAKKSDTITIVEAGEMPKRATMSGPKVVRVANRSTKQELLVEDDIVMDKSRKNAIQAKINREKKKVYIKSLETEVGELKGENQKLRAASSKLLKEKASLTEEVAYLKSILANQSALSGLLENIGNTSGVSLSTSFSNRKRAASTEHDHDYGTANKKVKTHREAFTGGVCLHVYDEENVSLEFCAACAKKAADSS